SERKVKHIPISGHLQFIAISVLSVGFVWASYSTGSFIAARSALKEQGQALRSVTNAHIESSLGVTLKTAPEAVDVGPYKRGAEAAPILNTAATAMAGMDKAKLVARIALLESKVIELKNTNEAIVQRVQDKTSGKLNNLESIVKQTGLNMSELKRQMLKKAKDAAEEEDTGSGGPYIPEEGVNLSPQAKDMLGNLDELVLVSRIVNTLPLAEPLDHFEEHSHFGHRVDPINGHLAFHSGIDLAGPAGAKIRSTAAGTVVSSGANGAYGNAVDIDHGFGIVTRYGHLHSVSVEEGQKVAKGEVIGVQGSTGRSTGPHLHYEVRYHDKAMNPKKFLEAGQHVLEE
ncbi:MAG: M23 family metallopeptidase, partial [Rickettsiales bacterium]|nr:M23 family metallopeptidase [Rickettsiales bacterium]